MEAIIKPTQSQQSGILFSPQNRKIKLLSGWDIPLWLILGLLLFFGWQQKSPKKEQASRAMVQIDNQFRYQFDLAKEGTFEINGANFQMKLQVKEGAIAVSGSQCRHQICRKSGAIRYPGESIICVPNKTMIYIPVEKDYAKREINAITG